MYWPPIVVGLYREQKSNVHKQAEKLKSRKMKEV